MHIDSAVCLADHFSFILSHQVVSVGLSASESSSFSWQWAECSKGRQSVYKSKRYLLLPPSPFPNCFTLNGPVSPSVK